MTTTDHAISFEEQIDRWRSYLRRRQAIHSVDVAELVAQLRHRASVDEVSPQYRGCLLRSELTAAPLLSGHDGPPCRVRDTAAGPSRSV